MNFKRWRLLKKRERTTITGSLRNGFLFLFLLFFSSLSSFFFSFYPREQNGVPGTDFFLLSSQSISEIVAIVWLRTNALESSVQACETRFLLHRHGASVCAKPLPCPIYEAQAVESSRLFAFLAAPASWTPAGLPTPLTPSWQAAECFRNRSGLSRSALLLEFKLGIFRKGDKEKKNFFFA